LSEIAETVAAPEHAAPPPSLPAGPTYDGPVHDSPEAAAKELVETRQQRPGNMRDEIADYLEGEPIR
jgi:hypothetical protein